MVNTEFNLDNWIYMCKDSYKDSSVILGGKKILLNSFILFVLQKFLKVILCSFIDRIFVTFEMLWSIMPLIVVFTFALTNENIQSWYFLHYNCEIFCKSLRVLTSLVVCGKADCCFVFVFVFVSVLQSRYNSLTK